MILSPDATSRPPSRRTPANFFPAPKAGTLFGMEIVKPYWPYPLPPRLFQLRLSAGRLDDFEDCPPSWAVLVFRLGLAFTLRVYLLLPGSVDRWLHRKRHHPISEKWCEELLNGR